MKIVGGKFIDKNGQGNLKRRYIVKSSAENQKSRKTKSMKADTIALSLHEAV